jgi:hypothetical protein
MFCGFKRDRREWLPVAGDVLTKCVEKLALDLIQEGPKWIKLSG